MLGINIVDYQDTQAPILFTQSLHSCGFVLVEGAPIDPSLIALNYRLWHQFYLGTDKHNYLWDEEQEDGYVPPNLSETAKGQTIKDLKEFYHITPNGRAPALLKKEAAQLFNQLSECGKTFLSWIENSLPDEVKSQLSEPLTQMIQNSPNTVLRTIHYPPLSGTEPKGAVRAAAHEDINLLTVLPAATAEGLEVMDHHGQWHRLQLKPNQLVVNTGDMLKECTEGYIKSTSHRVVNPPQSKNESRLSMPLFLHPRNEVVLSDRYTAGAYRKERITENGLQDIQVDALTE